MNLFPDIQRAYFLGIGGIGMSAVARYLLANGIDVAGYDRVSTHLTDTLSREGIRIFFDEAVEYIPEEYRNRENMLVIYTPAIPGEHASFKYFRKEGFRIMKRSEALGLIFNSGKGIAVAGTHGKTTVSSIIAHILNDSAIKCNAFLGGISNNLHSNLLLNDNAEYTVAEADEFDRSFLHLHPQVAVITSVDEDHLDVYGNYENLKSAFTQFIHQIRKEGILVYKNGLAFTIPEGIRSYTYSLSHGEADFYPENIRRDGFRYTFDLHTPSGIIYSLKMNVYGKLNLENAIAATSIACLLGISEDKIRDSLGSYAGVWRRFDVRIENENFIYIDDYAHHPEELRALINSVREALPGRKITGIFQPHLYSRTRDFMEGFARSLSLLDHVILLHIYPAREKAIPGINSHNLLELLKNPGEKALVSTEQLLDAIGKLNPEILLTMGAGDIDKLVKPIENYLKEMKG